MQTLKFELRKSRCVCSDCWEGQAPQTEGNSLYKNSEQAWYHCRQAWSGIALPFSFSAWVGQHSWVDSSLA